jgi:hypothetical protein
MFEPNRIDSMTGGKRWSVSLNEIRNLGVEQRGTNLLSGGIRNRLRVDCIGADSSVFVVNHLDDVLEVLRSAVRAAK